jgi:HK97 family phage prohead protease
MEYMQLGIDVKSLTGGGFEGHGSVFGNVDLGGDVVMKGAFGRTLSEHKSRNKFPLMFRDHDPRHVPGKWTAMHEDETGLYVKGEFVDTPLGNETRTLLKSGAISGLSIGYSIPKGGSEYRDDGARLLKHVDLWEVSVVSLPMNQLAEVEAAKFHNLPEPRRLAILKQELETILREQRKMSRKDAQTEVSRLFDDAGAIPAKPDLSDSGPDEAAMAAALGAFKSVMESEPVRLALRRLSAM